MENFFDKIPEREIRLSLVEGTPHYCILILRINSLYRLLDCFLDGLHSRTFKSAGPGFGFRGFHPHIYFFPEERPWHPKDTFLPAGARAAHERLVLRLIYASVCLFVCLFVCLCVRTYHVCKILHHTLLCNCSV